MVLLVQLKNEKDSVEILFDKEGLDLLKSIINKDWYEPIVNENKLYNLDHEHLNSREWGGDELTTQFTSKDSHKIQSVKIVYLGNEGEALLSE